MPIGPLDDWFSIIFCDYGEEGVKFPIFRSYSKETPKEHGKNIKINFLKMAGVVGKRIKKAKY